MLSIVQVSSRIWEQVIVSLHPDSFKDVSAFIAWLPSDQPAGKAGAAAALLANLAQVSGTALQVQALHFLHLSLYAVETTFAHGSPHPQVLEVPKLLSGCEPILWCHGLLTACWACMCAQLTCKHRTTHSSRHCTYHSALNPFWAAMMLLPSRNCARHCLASEHFQVIACNIRQLSDHECGQCSVGQAGSRRGSHSGDAVQ